MVSVGCILLALSAEGRWEQWVSRKGLGYGLSSPKGDALATYKLGGNVTGVPLS